MILIHMKKIFLVFISIFLFSCSAGMNNVKSDYKIDKKSNNGVLVGSVKYNGYISGYKAHFRKIDGTFEGNMDAGAGIMLIPIPPKGDFSQYKGNLSAIELPSGDYEFYQWSIQSGVANTKSPYFSIKFRIQPGIATYAGSFLFKQTSSMGLTVTGADVKYFDDSNIDLAKMVELYPDLANNGVYLGIEKDYKKESIGKSGSTDINMTCSGGMLGVAITHLAIKLSNDKKVNVNCTLY